MPKNIIDPADRFSFDKKGTEVDMQSSNTDTKKLADSTAKKSANSTTKKATNSAAKKSANSTTKKATNSTAKKSANSTTKKVTDSNTKKVTDSADTKMADSIVKKATNSIVAKVINFTAKKKNDSTTTIISAPDKSENTDTIQNKQRQNLPFSVIESYKNIRTNLLSLIDNTDIKVICFSSPNASEGKSTTSMNVAMSISQLNKKVLLVDTDSLHPTVHKMVNCSNEKGCIDVISGEATLKSATIHYTPYLDILTAGNRPANSTELFDSPEFEKLLEKSKKSYDYVIVDTPPVNLVSDSLIVAKKCDALVLILRSSSTKYNSYRKALSSIGILKINLLGTIINRVNLSSGRYYKYKYNYKSYRYYY